MSKIKTPSPIDAKAASVGLVPLTELLIKHFGIHEGRFVLGVNLRIGVGAVPGPEGAMPLPGALMGVEGLHLVPAQDNANGPEVIDAARVNPPKRSRVKRNPAAA